MPVVFKKVKAHTGALGVLQTTPGNIFTLRNSLKPLVLHLVRKLPLYITTATSYTQFLAAGERGWIGSTSLASAMSYAAGR